MKPTSIFKNENISETRELGEFGEKLAAIHLVKNGYKIVVANFKVPVGRNRRGVLVNGEIDLVAYDGETLCFVEVKTRSSRNFATPEAAVDIRKQRQITRASRAYRRLFNLEKSKIRFDVISIVVPSDKSERHKIELFKGFWNEAKFRKSTWTDSEFVYF